MISVDWKGDIYPCIRYMESSLGEDQEPLIIGNVDRGILTTKEELDMHKCLTCITRRSQSTDECFYCPIAEGCSWCFPAGTKIWTPEGLRNIEELKIGDKVYDKDGKIQTVENNLSRVATDELIYVKAEELSDLLTTKDHPFYAKKIDKEPEWVKAEDLTSDYYIGMFKDNNTQNIVWSKIEESVLIPPESEEVYNLTVSDSHSYIANGAIVHNCTAYNYQVFGTPDARATYICIMHKARALANAYYWNKAYRMYGESKRMKIWIPDIWALEIISPDELAYLKKLASTESMPELDGKMVR